jgi:WD40 repeat protein
VKTGTLKHDLVGHSYSSAVSFSPDENLLASAGRWASNREDGTGVIIWNAQTGKKIRHIMTNANGGTRTVAFSPDSKLVAIGSQHFHKANDTSTGAVSLVYAVSGIMEWRHTVPSWAKHVAFSPDGNSVVVLCGGRSIRFLETETGKVKHEIRSADSPQGGRWNDFAITPQGHMLAIGGVDKLRKGSVQLWDFDGLGTAANSAPVKDGEN